MYVTANEVLFPVEGISDEVTETTETSSSIPSVSSIPSSETSSTTKEEKATDSPSTATPEASTLLDDVNKKSTRRKYMVGGMLVLATIGGIALFKYAFK